MAEAGEGEPKRCQCGFWGSPQTNNMCSKCYKEYQRNGAVPTTGEKNATQLLTQYSLLSSGLGSNTSSVEIREPQQPQLGEEEQQRASEAEVDQMNKEMAEAGNFLPQDLPQQKNRKKCWTCKTKLELAQRSLGECKCGEYFRHLSVCSHPFSLFHKTCVDTTTCDGYVFCLLHRLPEQHQCVYDHKDSGRQEALKTMVPASRRFGRSFHRMDSRPEQ